jgi:hypothetical protein
MKTLTRLMSVGAVLAAGGVSLAADCQYSTAPRVVYNNGGNVARYSYRSGYAGAVQVAPVMTTAPVRGGYMTPGGYSYNQSSLGPERHLEYAHARQAIRGW